MESSEKLVAHFLRGHVLDPQEVRILEEELKDLPDDVMLRAKLLGYYETHAPDHEAEQRRVDYILWFIKSNVGHPLFSRCFGKIFKMDEPENYKLLKDEWIRQTENNPSPCNFTSAAMMLTFSWELDEAQALLERAKTLRTEPEDDRLISQIEGFIAGRRFHPGRAAANNSS